MVSALSGFAIRRPNGAGSSRRSASIRSNLIPSAISNYADSKIAIAAANAVGIRALALPPGTEFLDAKTGRQKSALKRATVRRDQSLGIGSPKVPAETRPTRNIRFARAGWWRQLGSNWGPTTQSSNRSPLERGTEIFCAETGAQNPAFLSAETVTETTRSKRKPA